jgi:hypothetical protein
LPVDNCTSTITGSFNLSAESGCSSNISGRFENQLVLSNEFPFVKTGAGSKSTDLQNAVFSRTGNQSIPAFSGTSYLLKIEGGV